jgi:RNA polymerase sigma-70 factor (ECF subfamily)
LFAIARHKLIDRYRFQAKRVGAALDETCEPASERELELRLAEWDIDVALEQLPEKQAAAIRCVKLQGLSISEAARATGQSIPAVKVGIHRGLKKLLSIFGRGRQ